MFSTTFFASSSNQEGIADIKSNTKQKAFTDLVSFHPSDSRSKGHDQHIMTNLLQKAPCLFKAYPEQMIKIPFRIVRRRKENLQKE